MDARFTNNHITIIVLTSLILGIGTGAGYKELYLLNLIPVLIVIYAFMAKLPLKKIVISSSVVFIFGFYYALYRTPVIEITDLSNYAPAKNVSAFGEVTSEPRNKGEALSSFVLNVNKVLINGENKVVTGKVNVTLNSTRKIEIGQKLKVTGYLSKPKAPSNPYQFDYKSYLLKSGISSKMYIKENKCTVLSEPVKPLHKFLNKISDIKDRIYEVHKKALNTQEAQLLSGIVLGDRAVPLKKEDKEKFVNSGLAHILAASGINVALLALAWIFITSRLLLPASVQYIGGMLLVLIYALLTGLPPSVLRASLMLELVLLGKLISKDSDMIAIITVVAGVLLLFDPFMILDIGFQLSFITALGLLVSIPVMQKYIKTIPQPVAMIVLIPFIAQIWASPIILFHFHTLAHYSIVANMFAMPLVAVITYGGFLSSALSLVPLIGEALAINIDRLLSPCLDFLINLAGEISGMPSSIGHIPVNSVFEVVAFYCVIGVLLLFSWKKYSLKAYIILLSALLFTFMIFQLLKPADNLLRIVFFDVDNADAIFIETPEKKYILIDGGKRFGDKFNSGDWIIKPYLYSRGINSIDAMILTHPENDHIGGFPEIMEDLPVEHLFDAGFSSKNKAYSKLLKLAYSQNIPYHIIRRGDILNFSDNISLKILNPAKNADLSKKYNRQSLVTRLDYKDFSILFTGDTENKGLTGINNILADVDIIKVGHHGSKKSLDANYLKLTTPELAIISAGDSKKHPAINIIRLLEINKIKYLITRDCGAIEITSDGKNFKIKTIKNPASSKFNQK